MAYRVFVSYSTNDFPAVERVRRILSSPAVEIFIAEYSVAPGTPLSKEILDAIRSCDQFILLWSKNSRGSEWVTQEIGIARGQEKPILPIVLEHGLQLPAFISDLKYLDASQNADEAYLWLQHNVFQKVQKQQQTNALIGLGIAAAFVWLITRE